MKPLVIECLVGSSAGRKVLLGFAAADLLHRVSFADVLNEDLGHGYQRRFNPQHSLDFRRYIQHDGATTIPLTFNLRPCDDESWKIKEHGAGKASLVIREPAPKILAQVDCQHRLGHLKDLSIELPFMSFIGLSPRAEMEIFNIINSKAKGLSTSLLDFHDAQLSTDLGAERPELFIALYLRNEAQSPWHRQLDLGGKTSSGMNRRASLRTMQKAVKRFLARTKGCSISVQDAAHAILEYWAAVQIAMPRAWVNPRNHLLTKGIGVYALMDLAADLYKEAPKGRPCDRRYFASALIDFAADFDWSTEGPLNGLGGESGVKAAGVLLRQARMKSRLKVVANG